MNENQQKKMKYYLEFFVNHRFLIKSINIIILILIFGNSFNNKIFDNNFDYVHYENDIITEKIIKDSDWLLELNHAYLINGLIRKHRPKNCLEIGVGNGGSSVLILNAIKDISESSLVSIDLYTWKNKTKKLGYVVEEKFPELTNKWKLFLGSMSSKILSKLNIKYDFLFLDSAHVTPGEYFNIIEALPFLKENAIIVLHDIVWHFYKILKTDIKSNKLIHPTQINLMSTLIGKKILLKSNTNTLLNIGAVFLEKNQKKYYLNYFLLLLNVWSYMPTDKQLEDLREFIIKYYNNSLFLRIYDNAVDFNKRIFNKLNKEEIK